MRTSCDGVRRNLVHRRWYVEVSVYLEEVRAIFILSVLVVGAQSRPRSACPETYDCLRGSSALGVIGMTVPKHHVRRRLLRRHNDSPLLFQHGVLEQKHMSYFKS